MQKKKKNSYELILIFKNKESKINEIICDLFIKTIKRAKT